MAWQAEAERVGALLRGARRVLVITGAGLGADSGLPTYRGVGGLYDNRDTEDGLPIEEALSGDMMLDRPSVPWRYLRQIEESVRGRTFNRGHEVIAALQDGREVTVLTQNVDGFHTAAGSRDVIEIHGNFQRIRCLGCRRRFTVRDYGEFGEGPGVPVCEACGAVLRPEVVLFGEALPLDAVGRLQAVLARGVDLVVSVGTTSVFPYIAGPVFDAAARGIPTVEVNPGTTQVSSLVDVRVIHGAAEALDLAYRAMRAG